MKRNTVKASIFSDKDVALLPVCAWQYLNDLKGMMWLLVSEMVQLS